VVNGHRDRSIAQLSVSEYVNEGLEDYKKYTEASSLWRSALRQFEIDMAYFHFRNYVREAAPDNIPSHPENLFPVFAAAELGELDISRKILRKMLNPKFLDSDVNQHSKTERSSLQTAEDMLQEYFEIDNVLAACVLSQDWDLACRLLGKIRKLFPKYIDTDVERIPTTSWSRLAYAGVIYECNNLPLEAFELLFRASQLVEQDRSSVSDPNSRRGIFSSDPFGEIFHGLARLCLRAGEHGLPLVVLEEYPHNHLGARTWQEHALLFLEQAKARNLLESLAANQQDSTDTGTRASRALKCELKVESLALKPLRHLQKEDLETLETKCEGYDNERDPLRPTFEITNSAVKNKDLYRAIGEDEIVIEADFSGQGFTLFGVTSIGIEFAQHRYKTWYEMRILVSRVMKHLADYPKDKDPDAAADLDVLLKAMSDELILPLQDLIQKKKHVIFIASQPLAAFPFSTLLLDDEPLFLRVAVSQVPSLRTLMYLWKSSKASESNQETSRSLVSVTTIAKPARLVKTGNKTPHEEVLFFAAIEAMIIARIFNNWPLDGSHISGEEFKSLIQTGNLGGTDNSDARIRLLHIGTHGDYDRNNPWQSYISLKERFRILDIDHKKPRGHRRLALIVFAACLSGMGQGTLGNDVLGFAQAMLERDCNAYLGALWKVNDHAPMLLMVFFYRHLYKSVTGASKSSPQIARLWQDAQKSLYHLTIEGAKELVADLVKVLEGAERDGHNPKAFVKLWRSRLESVVEKMEQGKLDLKHPFNWGAFVVVGYGSMVLVPSQD
jgi:CHAT domain-containing protein